MFVHKYVTISQQLKTLTHVTIWQQKSLLKNRGRTASFLSRMPVVQNSNLVLSLLKKAQISQEKQALTAAIRNIIKCKNQGHHHITVSEMNILQTAGDGNQCNLTPVMPKDSKINRRETFFFFLIKKNLTTPFHQTIAEKIFIQHQLIMAVLLHQNHPERKYKENVKDHQKSTTQKTKR